MGGACSTNGREDEVLGRKSRGKEITRKTKACVVDNIKMDLGNIG
jgi:hypothetical protein